MKGFIRLIGDVHGHHGNYVNLIKKAKYSVQLGDMGLRYDGMETVDVSRHRFVPGNHDNYDNLPPHALPGDYGMFKFDDWEFMYIRGAYSVDKAYRIVGRSWWPQEEITWEAGNQLVEFVKEHKPKVVLSHDCPFVCYERGVLTNHWKMTQSLTCQILSAVFEVWKPELWVFGHHHNDWQMVIDGTQFVCLSELSSLDIYPDGKKVWNPSKRM